MTWYKPGRDGPSRRSRQKVWAPIGQAGRVILLVTVIVGIVIALMITTSRTAGAADSADGAASQPEPSAPPWFGGRVEMPKNGFALTLPDGWVAFDLSGDLDRQADAASERIDAGALGLSDAHRVFQSVKAMLDNAAASGLLMADPPALQACVFIAYPTPVDDFWGFAEFYYGDILDRPEATDVAPPVEVDLPAGLAFFIDYAWSTPDRSSLRSWRSTRSTAMNAHSIWPAIAKHAPRTTGSPSPRPSSSCPPRSS
jgi:hypothetical protein